MASWADDPELVATFRAEVEERLASLCTGLLRLESHPSPKQLVAAMFRDAHTVKGSARMLGLDGVVGVAHRCEDLLGAVRDGRVGVRKDVVDLLLAAADGIGRALPGAEHPLADGDLDALVAALDGALEGEEPVRVPRLRHPDDEIADDVEVRPRSGDSIRVPTRRVHDLIDVLGEAELDVRRVTAHAVSLTDLTGDQGARVRDLLTAIALYTDDLPPEIAAAVSGLVAVGDQLSAATRDLRGRLEDTQTRLTRVREAAMGLAMVPLRRVLAGFPKLVREVATATGKDVRLVLVGEDVELDTRVLDAVGDALRHLVTNAVDHGCETSGERQSAGKSAQATVKVAARAAGSTVVIEVTDDGRGVDEDALRSAAVRSGLLAPESTLAGPGLLQLLFTPGFSTRAEVTETSGRGVGLDVVRTVVEDLGGGIDIGPGEHGGTRFTLTLPVTLGVLRCLVARVGDERYALPVPGVVETVSLADCPVHEVAGQPVLERHGVTVPLADLGVALGAPGERDPRAAVIVRYGGSGELLAWAVDDLEAELELVVKDLGAFLGRLPAIAGATLDDDGGVLLLVDARELALRQLAAGVPSPLPGGPTREPAATGDRAPTVLLVEDSVGVRELQRVILEGAGYRVTTAVDGLDGASRLTGDAPDLVLSDVEMPGMDGFTLTRTIRRTRGWEDVPVVIMTSRGDDADRRAGLDAGADAYLLKSEFDQQELVDTVRRLVGR